MLLPDEREIMNTMLRYSRSGWKSPSERDFCHRYYLTFMRLRRMREASRIRNQKTIQVGQGGIYG